MGSEADDSLNLSVRKYPRRINYLANTNPAANNLKGEGDSLANTTIIGYKSPRHGTYSPDTTTHSTNLTYSNMLDANDSPSETNSTSISRLSISHVTDSILSETVSSPSASSSSSVSSGTSKNILESNADAGTPKSRKRNLPRNVLDSVVINWLAPAHLLEEDIKKYVASSRKKYSICEEESMNILYENNYDLNRSYITVRLLAGNFNERFVMASLPRMRSTRARRAIQVDI